MKREDSFLTEQLIQYTILSYKGGFISAEQAFIAFCFAANLDYGYAKKIIEKCETNSLSEIFKSD